MAKQKTMLDHMLSNLTPGQIAELTDVAREMFPDVAATFAQREPNRRETWLMGLMAEHTWRRKVIYSEFYDAFRVGAMTDTYSDSVCRQTLKGNLEVCCPGWEFVTEEDGIVSIQFPSLEDVRASCEKAFGKISWPKTDEVLMVSIRQAAEAEAAEKERQEAYDDAVLKTAVEWREAILPTKHKITNKERELSAARAAPGATVVNAEKALAEAMEAHEKAVAKAYARQQEQIRGLQAAR